MSKFRTKGHFQMSDSIKTIENLNNEITKVKTRVKYKTSLMIFVIALLVMITATLAWFTISGLAGTDGLDINCTTGNDLKISTTNKGTDMNAWEKTVTADMINAQLQSSGYKKLDEILLTPLSTRNASSNIGTRLFLQNGTERTEEGPRSGQYLLMKLWFISDNDVKVYLTDKESESGANDGTKITSNSTNNASQANIIRTARISFASDSASTKIYEVENRVYAGQSNAFSSISNNTDSNYLFSLQAKTPKEVTVRLWIEGEDPLCVDDVAEASFKVQLMFESEEIED